jgi:hypothetical protein
VSTQPRVHEARAFVFELVGVGEHEYDTVTEVLGEDPPGRLFHLAGPTEDGWMVVSVWESQEAFDAFLTERLLPVVRKVGFFASLPQSFPIHNMDGLAASW